MPLRMPRPPTLTATPLCIEVVTMVIETVEFDTTISTAVDSMTAAIHAMLTTHAHIAKSTPDSILIPQL